MPRIQRAHLPERVLRHLIDRMKQREVTLADIQSLAAWLDTSPEVPAGPWFKRFPTFVVCGQGELVKTFLAADQTAIGEEV
jgi:hypothetical protein